MEAYHILIVEDDKEILDGVGIYMKNQGYEVFKAQNGLEGLKILEKEEIHLAIIDIMMPIMDGLEAARQIRSSNRADGLAVPIIAMSANAFEEDIEKSLAAGMNEHLIKPLDGSEVSDTMKKYLANKIVK